jgi:hypothetical protein
MPCVVHTFLIALIFPVAMWNYCAPGRVSFWLTLFFGTSLASFVSYDSTTLGYTGLSGDLPPGFSSLDNLAKVYLQGTSITGNLNLFFCREGFDEVKADCIDTPNLICQCCSECCDQAGDNCKEGS